MATGTSKQVISASRRTDIPNLYASWFIQRIQERHVLVRQVRDAHQVRRVDLSPSQVACIVFWTKNPAPMIPLLPRLSSYPYYFHFTITPYGTDLEPRIPPIGESIDSFRKLADLIGVNRIIWRYDPILFTERYPMGYHMEVFANMAERLSGYTDTCVFSFLDHYRHIEGNLLSIGVVDPAARERDVLVQHMAKHTAAHGMRLVTCAEPFDFSRFGVEHGSCIDADRVERLSGYAITEQRDKNQRPHCRCAPSVDVGMYNTCLNLCTYCYANHSEQKVHANYAQARSGSPLLYGILELGDVISDVPASSGAAQLSLFGDQDP